MTSVLHRSFQVRYPEAVGSSGMYLEDAAGKRYLDMSGGAAAACLGHGHPDVLSAIHEQLDRMAYAHTSFFTNAPQERLADLLVSRFGDDQARVYFTSGGSEANETALKIAWQYWKARGLSRKKIIISREDSYHGNTMGGLSASGNPTRRIASAVPLQEWPRIEPCYAYRLRKPDESARQYGVRAAEQLGDAIEQAGAENVAAFICEPVVGSSLGAVPAEPGYLKRIRDICDSHEILFIADEIMCGSGRTGTFYAHEFDGARPDIVTLAKAIGGGYQPLAATVISGRIIDELETAGFAHGHTYIGHATACAAGLAVQRVIDRDGLLERTREQGTKLKYLLRSSFGDHPNVGNIRGRGLFIGIELVADRDSKQGFADATGLPEQLRAAAMSEGLVCYPGHISWKGATVPHVLLAPPMILEDRHMDECVEKLGIVLGRVLRRQS